MHMEQHFTGSDYSNEPGTVWRENDSGGVVIVVVAGGVVVVVGGGGGM